MTVMRRNWISDRIKFLGKKKKDLAEALGLPHTRISDIIAGTRALKVTEVKAFADFMEMAFEDVIKRFSNAEEDEWPSYDTLVSDEQNVIDAYRGLSESGKQKFQAFVDVVKDSEE